MPDPLWITYAWKDNDEGDFDYLVQKLQKVGISSLYDKIALIPGRRLWHQIAHRISSSPLSGWAYLVTPNSLLSSACREELSYALQRTLEAKGEEFPLIGLLHKVSIGDVPMPLRVRLCVSLTDPDWAEQVRAGVEGKPPGIPVPRQEAFVLKIHENYLGRQGWTAIEIRPRFSQITYWRMAFPSNGPQPVVWGTGPANGGGIGGAMFTVVEGEYQDMGGVPMKFKGAANPLSSAMSAYAVFDGPLPDRLFFGEANEPFGANAKGAVISLRQ
jgi:hypothetical protein